MSRRNEGSRLPYGTPWPTDSNLGQSFSSLSRRNRSRVERRMRPEIERVERVEEVVAERVEEVVAERVEVVAERVVAEVERVAADEAKAERVSAGAECMKMVVDDGGNQYSYFDPMHMDSMVRNMRNCILGEDEPEASTSSPS